MHLELAVAVLDVCADGVQGNAELAADLLVAGAERQQPQHGGLPRRQHGLLPYLWPAGPASPPPPSAPPRPARGRRQRFPPPPPRPAPPPPNTSTPATPATRR